MVHPTMDQIMYGAIDDGSATAQSHSMIHPGHVAPPKVQTLQHGLVSDSQPIPAPATAKDKTQTEPIQDQASKESTEELSMPRAGPRGRKRSDKVHTLERSKNKDASEDDDDENARALSAIQSNNIELPPKGKPSHVGRSLDSSNP